MSTSKRAPDLDTVVAALIELGLAPAAAGTNDALAVRVQTIAFQREWDLPQTGQLDHMTCVCVIEVLEAHRIGQRGQQPGPCRAVYGRVTSASGEPAPGLRIELFAVGFRSEHKLATTKTGRDGGYELAYPRHALDARTALLVRVFDDAVVAQSAPQFHVAPVIEIDLTVDPSHLHGPTELERLAADVLARIGKTALTELTAADVRFLAGATGWPADQLTYFVIASQLQAKRSVDAALFYALFREDALGSARSMRLQPRFVIDLTTDQTALYYDVVLLDPATLRASVAQAIAARLVPGSLAGELDQIFATLANSTASAQAYALTQVPARVFNSVASDLQAGKLTDLRGVLQTDARGDVTRLAASVSAIGFSEGSAAPKGVSIGDLLNADPSLLDELRTIVLGSTGGTAGEPTPVQPTAAAQRHAASARATAAFVAELERDGAQPALAHGAKLLDLLKANPSFDLLTGSADKLVRAQPADARPLREPLQAAQRVFKLAPSYRQTTALLGAGMRSAAHVAAMGRTRFVKRFTQDGTFTEREAHRAFQRAVDIHTATGFVAAELRSYGATAAHALTHVKTVAALQAVSRDNPNLTSLFHLIDLCECEDCNSSQGAAAYFVDALQFLKNREVVDRTLPPPALDTKTAKDVLFARRPDLGDLDLSCDNTNVTLPYIDLVNELLEDAVAPDPGFAYAGALVAGVAPAALVAALTAQQLPFTATAVLQGPDLSGAFAVRDARVVCKLTPTGPGTWNVRNLRQTFQSADELAAAPAYQNDAAYSVLRGSNIAFHLPFDVFHEEAAGYFAQFGIARSDLMRALSAGGVPALRDIAADALGLADDERVLIATPGVALQPVYWNTPGSPASDTIKQVERFLTQTELDFAGLTDLLARAFVNPGSAVFVQDTGTNNVTVLGATFPFLTADTSQKQLAGLTDDVLDRIHRFLRLQRRLGWTLDTTDRAIMADRLGRGVLDDALLIQLADLVRLGARLSGLAIDLLVTVYGALSTDGDPSESDYTRVFFNAAASGVVDAQLAQAAVTANQGLPLASQHAFGDVDPAALAVAINVTPADLAALIAAANAATVPWSQLTFVNLTRLWSYATLAVALGRTIADVLLIQRLSGIDPLASPAAGLRFAAESDRMASAGVKPADLAFLLGFPASAAARTLPDASIAPVLSAIQLGLQAAWQKARAPFDAAGTTDENKAGLRALLAQLPGVAAADLATFETIVDGTFPGDPTAYVDGLVVPAIDPAPILTRAAAIPPDAAAVVSAQTQLDAAQAQLVAATTAAQVTAAQAAIAAAQLAMTAAQDQLRTDQLALIQVVLDEISAYLYHQARAAVIVNAVGKPLRITQPMATAVLEGAQLAGRLLVDVLADGSLLDTVHAVAQLPVIGPIAFADQYAAIRLLNQIGLFAAAFTLTSDATAWLLAHAAALGWLRIDQLPYQVGGAAIPLAAWDQLWDVLALIGRYPAAANPADAAAPFDLWQVFALALGGDGVALLDRLAAVTGWDRQALAELDARFGFSTPDLAAYRMTETYQALDQAIVLLRTLGVTVAGAVPLTKPQLGAADARALRQALKARYDAATWLGVLKAVMDPLRQRKRDALVGHVLAHSPTMQSSDDLFDYFLLDVEMCSCMSTSRIVAAHGTLQLFVQRCLLGIEPKAIADVAADDGWSQWSWMSQFRVWQANREIFDYPENWLDETLRDDKSELFLTLEHTLRQNPLTDDNITNAAIDYLQGLDDIAFLEVVAMYYEERIYTMHVFARTKGGDPAVYYYRQFVEEHEWTPWQKVDLDITGDIVMAFIRDGRLHLAWPIFSEQPNNDQAISIPSSVAGTPVEKTERAWQIQLAISEYANGVWQAKRTSKEALDWVDTAGYYQKLPTKDLFRFIPLDLRAAGFSILVTFIDDGTDLSGTQLTGTTPRYLGAFTLTGCKGYPEPLAGNRTVLEILPTFHDTTLTDLRFVESADRTADDLQIETFLGRRWVTLFERTPGTFKVTYPQDFSLIDLVLYLIEIWQRSQGAAAGTNKAFESVERFLVLPLGTFMPYFYEDGARGYVAIPGYYAEPDANHGFARTARFTFSNALQLLQDIIALVKRYLLLFEQDPSHNLLALIQQLVVDPDYLTVRDQILVWSRLRYGVEFDNFYHPLVCALRKTLYADGIPALMKRATQLQQTSFSFATNFQPTATVLRSYPTGKPSEPYAVEDVDFSLGGAYAGYNWELFFHLPFEIGVRLSKDQQFEAAMSWLQYIFDPTDASSGSVPQKYWKTKPFFLATDTDYIQQRIDSILDNLAADPTGAAISGLQFAVSQWRDHPFEPFVVARSRPVAFQQAVLMAYLDNLIAWGDSLFTQFTMETVAQATQLYVLADKLLGPKPRIVPPIVLVPTESFNSLEAKIDLFGNAMLDLESLIPDLSLLPHGGQELPQPPPLTLYSLYFCVPPNPKLLQYWDTVADRLFKIRNCEDITGTPRSLALFAPPIDPGALVAAAAAGLSPSQIVAGLNAPLPCYRFASMVQKAGELTQQVISLGNALQAALEKRDAEALSVLKANQELLVLNLVRAQKQAQIQEAGVQVTALQKSIDMTTFKSQYYHARPFINDQESLAQDLTTSALISQAAALALDVAAGIGHLIPWLGIGAAGFGGSPQANANYGGSNIGNSSLSFADVARQTATILQTRSGLATQLGSFQRRQDEWTFQAQLADKELVQLGVQIAAARLRQDIATKDLASHQQSIDNSIAALRFLRTKFTNQDLYEYLVDQISGTYFQAYQLAFDCAQQAQHCYQYEIGTTATFVSYSYWDSLRKGLFAGDALQADLKRLEKAYYDQNRREYELTKNVSLAQLDPLALLQLKTTGACLFNLPETMFDLDHPGHYFRRLKTVSLTVPCVAGPYTSVSCTLSLVGNRYRKLTDPGTGYAEAATGDARFVYNVGAIQQIATSQGQSDNGLFEMNFRDERYLPFEGQGAIGSWRLELPSAYRQFDYNTITDVVMTLKYTARDGGSGFGATVDGAIRDLTTKMVIDAKTTGLVQGYNVRLEFPDEWFRFQQTGAVTLQIPTDSLPYFATGHTPAIQRATWLARVTGNPASCAMSVDGTAFNLAQNATLAKLCAGDSVAVTLDTPFALASASASAITELSLIVNYTLGS